MKMIFVLKQTVSHVKPLSDNFLESLARGIKRMVEMDETPIICLPFGFELQMISLDGEKFDEITVRYEDKNGNEITRPVVWK
jgi:hypothetical protein